MKQIKFFLILLLFQLINYQVLAQDFNSGTELRNNSVTSPDYLVWVGPQVWGPSLASGDSLFAAIAANGASVGLTDSLFEFGPSLSHFKAIFVVLGIVSYNHILNKNAPEAKALEAYLRAGGRLYLEGGDCFNYDPEQANGYNIRPWFGLRKGFDGAFDVFQLQGLDFLTGSTFSYQGPNRFMDELEPDQAVPIWRKGSGKICGVWSYSFGAGLAIGIVPAFSGMARPALLNYQEPGADAAPARHRLERKPSSKRKLVKKLVDPMNPNYSQSSSQQVHFSPAQIKISASTKIELMAAYLSLLQSNPPFCQSAKADSGYRQPQIDSVIIQAKIINPDEHSLLVQALIVATDSVVVDSVRLLDDGHHFDSAASDNFYGGFWPIPEIEENFTVHIRTRSLDLGTTHLLKDVGSFTSRGPVHLHHFELTNVDTIPNPGDRIYLKLYLQNQGTQAPVTDVSARLMSLDACASVANFALRFGTIEPGQLATTFISSYITFSSDCAVDRAALFALNISSGSHQLWQDTLAIWLRPTDVPDSEQQTLLKFALMQNYPNPFNQGSVISFTIAAPGHTCLNIYNATGALVQKIVDANLTPGYHRFSLDSKDLTSGIYLMLLQSGQWQESRKIVVIK